MFGQIVERSFYGSETPYVRGNLVKINDKCIEFRIPTEKLSDEELTVLKEIIEEANNVGNENNFILKSVIIDDVIMTDNAVIVPMKNIQLDCTEEVIAQASIRVDVFGKAYTHFQIKKDFDSEKYDKVDFHYPQLVVLIKGILDQYIIPIESEDVEIESAKTAIEALTEGTIIE